MGALEASARKGVSVRIRSSPPNNASIIGSGVERRGSSSLPNRTHKLHIMSLIKVLVLLLSFQGSYITDNHVKVRVTPTYIKVGRNVYQIKGTTFYNQGYYTEYVTDQGRIGFLGSSGSRSVSIILYSPTGWVQQTYTTCR